MIKYLVIFHIIRDYVMTGRSEVTNNWLFNDWDTAKEWADEKWMEKDVKDIQIYEYNGSQYVLIEKMHRGD